MQHRIVSSGLGRFAHGAAGRAILTTALLAAVAMQGCSGGITSMAGTSAVTADSTMSQVLITDAPSDQVLALGLTVNGIRMYDASGKYADVLTTPTTIEAAHLDARVEPLRAPLSIPQDTYTSVAITVSNPTVTYIDAATHKPVQATATLASGTDTVTLSTPITVTSTSAPIRFDLLVGQSVSLSGSAATVTPTFNVTQDTLSAAPTNMWNGRLNNLFGSFVSATTTSLVLTQPNSSNVTLTIDSNTQLQGFTTLSQLTAGELLDVDVAQQKDGSLLALRIHLGSSSATDEYVGPVTATTGTPVTSFTLAARQWLGAGSSSTTAGTATTFTVNSSTQFNVAAQFGSFALPSLPFTPVFNASTLIAGQNVAVKAASVSNHAGTATEVALAPQTVSGTVASVAQSGAFTVYTVTLPSGSSLASLTGASSVVVYSGASAQFQGGSANATTVGSAVRFNGLLFNDSGTLRMFGGACAGAPPQAPPQQHQ